MLRPRVFDVLVVYSQSSAVSASTPAATSPFRTPLYTPAYAYFLEECRRVGLRAAFTTTADITGDGQCRSYWVYSHAQWTPVRRTATTKFIFDKFTIYSTFGYKKWSQLFGSSSTQSFNNVDNTRLFGDKLLTYQTLSSFMIPTVAIADRTGESIDTALNQLATLCALSPNELDFEQSIILKDRHGAGGNKLYKISARYKTTILTLLHNHPKTSFIIQPFIRFDTGFTYNNTAQSTDIRLIYNNGSIIQTYIRRAKPNDFRCNDHQGGHSYYVALETIPTKVLAYAQRISQLISTLPSLHTLDFLISNSGTVYFIEGNISPGLYWNPSEPTESRMSKKLIRTIIREIVRRIHVCNHSDNLVAPAYIHST